ncbi:hypothetical protein SAMN06264364_14924 [Quadrisphaera granulorum]|uniref:DNA primase/polymerase bifunctional N-terminal domain-containing protein n=1 Tax=Quadrisphaera granulorum TaxID=317664 RepID=A0A315ZN48_9ACTN|nr:bifunctional DNA primase/polymerase [Quadrisphaera granulorum]PWJ46288.1 hypothetical protein BXY45_14924 [Quadrisphaera granulorum]SZE99103.1 hypothetical protein SAMN06264364_14924 [Quadrisphaera granulorum]
MSIIADSPRAVASDELLAAFGLHLPDGCFWGLDALGRIVPIRIEDDPDGWALRRLDTHPAPEVDWSYWDAHPPQADPAWLAEDDARWAARHDPIPEWPSEGVRHWTPADGDGPETWPAEWQELVEQLRAEQAAEDLAVVLLREAREERCDAPGWDGPGHLSLQALLSLEGVLLTLVDPERGKEPLMCVRREHAACVEFHDEEDCVSDDLELLTRVLAHHPQALVGIAPTGSLLVIDVDTKEALADLVEATGIVLRDHLVVRTAKGWHCYMRASVNLPAGALHGRPGIDLRYASSSVGCFVLGPEQTRADGGSYVVLYGVWGTVAACPPEVLTYLGWVEEGAVDGEQIRTNATKPPCAERWKLWGQQQVLEGSSLDGAVANCVARWQMLWDAYEADPQRGAGVEKGAQRSDSAKLMACWRITQWMGLTPEQAVDAVLAYRPALAVRITSEKRTRRWALQDAERVYRKPHLDGAAARTRWVWDGSEGAAVVAERIQKNSQLPTVWGHVVALVQDQQRTTHLGIGQVWLGDLMGTNHKSAGHWLAQLEKKGLLTRTGEHVWRSGEDYRRDNRVREFTVHKVVAVKPAEDAAATVIPAPRVWTEMALAA